MKSQTCKFKPLYIYMDGFFFFLMKILNAGEVVVKLGHV